MKFTQLFNQHDWKILHHQEVFDAVTSKSATMQMISALQQQQITLDPNKYIIAVGFNSLDYFMMVLLASALGLKMILCDAKMLKTLLENYQLNFQGILSTRALESTLPVFKINYENTTITCLPEIPLTTQQAQLIFFTSGTISLPKLVVYQEQTLLKNAQCVGQYLGSQKNSRVLNLFPTNYMYGFSTLMSTLLYDGTVMLERPTITATEIWDYLQHKKINILPIIRSIINQLNQIATKYPNAYFDDLIVLNASDRIYQEQIKNLLRYCPIFWNNFGQTEAGPRLFAQKITNAQINYLDQFAYRGVIAPGKIVDPYIHINIVDENNESCEINQVGKLLYSSPYAMEGYLDTKGNLEKIMWINSGDLVYQNADGFIYWVGRKKEIIKIDGKFINISLLHKYFDQIAGIEKSYFAYNDKTNELTGFFVSDNSIHQEKNNLEIVLSKHYRESFPSYPRIKKMLFVDHIPTTLTDKVNLRQLQNYYFSTESS